MLNFLAVPQRVLRITAALLIAGVGCNVSFAPSAGAQLDVGELNQKVVLIERARGGGLPPERTIRCSDAFSIACRSLTVCSIEADLSETSTRVSG